LAGCRIVLAADSSEREREKMFGLEGLKVVTVRNDGETFEFTVGKDGEQIQEDAQKALDFLNDKIKIISVGGDN
jgi:uncharacterized protein YkuJ